MILVDHKEVIEVSAHIQGRCHGRVKRKFRSLRIRREDAGQHALLDLLGQVQLRLDPFLLRRHGPEILGVLHDPRLHAADFPAEVAELVVRTDLDFADPVCAVASVLLRRKLRCALRQRRNGLRHVSPQQIHADCRRRRRQDQDRHDSPCHKSAVLFHLLRHVVAQPEPCLSFFQGKCHAAQQQDLPILRLNHLGFDEVLRVQTVKALLPAEVRLPVAVFILVRLQRCPIDFPVLQDLGAGDLQVDLLHGLAQQDVKGDDIEKQALSAVLRIIRRKRGCCVHPVQEAVLFRVPRLMRGSGLLKVLRVKHLQKVVQIRHIIFRFDGQTRKLPYARHQDRLAVVGRADAHHQQRDAQRDCHDQDVHLRCQRQAPLCFC